MQRIKKIKSFLFLLLFFTSLCAEEVHLKEKITRAINRIYTPMLVLSSLAATTGALCYRTTLKNYFFSFVCSSSTQRVQAPDASSSDKANNFLNVQLYSVDSYNGIIIPEKAKFITDLIEKLGFEGFFSYLVDNDTDLAVLELEGFPTGKKVFFRNDLFLSALVEKGLIDPRVIDKEGMNLLEYIYYHGVSSALCEKLILDTDINSDILRHTRFYNLGSQKGEEAFCHPVQLNIIQAAIFDGSNRYWRILLPLLKLKNIDGRDLIMKEAVELEQILTMHSIPVDDVFMRLEKRLAYCQSHLD